MLSITFYGTFVWNYHEEDYFNEYKRSPDPERSGK